MKELHFNITDRTTVSLIYSKWPKHILPWIKLDICKRSSWCRREDMKPKYGKMYSLKLFLERYHFLIHVMKESK